MINKVESTQDTDTEEESPSKEIQVGDRVKVLESVDGAEGEATVTAVLEYGGVELSGTNKYGTYSEGWSNHKDNLEKVESFEDEGLEEELYDFYEVVDDYIFHSEVKEGTILKRVGDVNNLSNNKSGRNLVTSTGLQQVSHMEDNAIKPVSGSHIKGRFEFAKEVGVILTTNTDFEEECKGSFFKVTKDKKESGSCFDTGAIVKIGHDDGSLMPSFYNIKNTQYVYLGAVQEIARIKKDK